MPPKYAQYEKPEAAIQADSGLLDTVEKQNGLVNNIKTKSTRP
jgi:hypothetical protein